MNANCIPDAAALRLMEQTSLIMQEISPPPRAPGFMTQLLGGQIAWDLLFPFPQQSAEEVAAGDAALARVDEFMHNHIDADRVDAKASLPQDYAQSLRDSGLLRLRLPREFGGNELSYRNMTRILELIGGRSSPVAMSFAAHHMIGLPVFAPFIRDETFRREVMQRMADGAITGIAGTEPQGASNTIYTTTATPNEDGSEFRINGHKLYIVHGSLADLLVVCTTTPEPDGKGGTRPGVTLFVVDTKTPGFSVAAEHAYMGFKGLPNSALHFDDVRVSASAIIGERGKGMTVVAQTIPTGKLFTPSMCLGVMKQCLGWLKSFSERRYLGMALSCYELPRETTVRIAADIYALETLVRFTSLRLDEKRVDISNEVSIAKVWGGELAGQAADATLQILAGQGYETASSLARRAEPPRPLERFFRDVRVHRVFGTTNEIMKFTLAQAALFAAPLATSAQQPLLPDELQPAARELNGLLAAFQQVRQDLVQSSDARALAARQTMLLRVAHAVGDMALMALVIARSAQEQPAARPLAMQLARHFCVQRARGVRDNLSHVYDDDRAITDPIADALFTGTLPGQNQPEVLVY